MHLDIQINNSEDTVEKTHLLLVKLTKTLVCHLSFKFSMIKNTSYLKVYGVPVLDTL